MTWGFGKVILLGEHAVVYDHPAIAGALSLGVRCCVNNRGQTSTRLVVPAWNVEVSCDDDTQLGHALTALVDELDARDAGLHLRAEVAVPSAAGLGSSAALAVAITRAIAAEQTIELSDTQVARIANEAERCFHGTPSGIDVALAARGGLGVFTRSTGLCAIAAQPVTLAIGLSGQPKRTSDMVARVAHQVDSNPNMANAVLDELGGLAQAGVDALETANLAQLGNLMNRAHSLLATLGLSTDVLDDMVNVARRSGAIGAKLTGGGGGGAVIALAPGREADVVTAWHQRGWQGFECTVGTDDDNS